MRSGEKDLCMSSMNAWKWTRILSVPEGRASYNMSINIVFPQPTSPLVLRQGSIVCTIGRDHLGLRREDTLVLCSSIGS